MTTEAAPTLGEILAEVRGARSIRHMATLCGIDFSLLAKIEKGEIALPRRDTMAALARGYDVDLDDLAKAAYS